MINTTEQLLDDCTGTNFDIYKIIIDRRKEAESEVISSKQRLIDFLIDAPITQIDYSTDAWNDYQATLETLAVIDTLIEEIEDQRR